MELLAITVSVQYDDILQHMLEQNSRFIHKWFIVTSPEDKKTIELIEKTGKENIETVIYTDFYKNNAKFNFGGARLFAQNYIDSKYKSANILFLDGDIYLPDNFMEKLPNSLMDDTLYGTQRTDYWTLEDFRNETNPQPKKNAKFQGYFQLYKQNTKYMYSDSYNCSKCDDIFKNTFANKIMLDICVKHLGQNGPNWDGRNYTNGIF